MIWDESWFMLMFGVALGISIAISYEYWAFRLKCFWRWNGVKITIGLILLAHAIVPVGEIASLFIPQMYWLLPYFIVSSVPIIIFDVWLYCNEFINRTWKRFKTALRWFRSQPAKVRNSKKVRVLVVSPFLAQVFLVALWVQFLGLFETRPGTKRKKHVIIIVGRMKK
jgi:hypothetical protein